jgi:glycine/D-amino acid oxidase-like deaminating enzyme/Fe-S-cluster-containing hydrogenase component 2
VVIIGAGPAGLATRQELNKHNISNIVIDAHWRIGGQFNMQTHQFFFFEKEKLYGGMRGFDIATTLAGDSTDGIFLNSTVWDLLSDKRIAVKNIVDDSIFYVDADYLVVATGAVPFMPVFENDDLPGVYTAAVVQKMMNNQFCLLGKKMLTIGAGNIGYLTSYQAMQAGAKVVAILEAQNKEGGFPVQANRVRRLGIPILTSHILLKAIPNKDYTGITGAVVAKCENFKPVAGSEFIIDNIDAINICTGLIPDDQLLIKAKQVFANSCYGVGDAVRIGEGTSAVLRGRQAAMEIVQQMQKPFNYNDYLTLSKEYIDSQQHPVRCLKTPRLPNKEREQQAPFVVIDCLYGFACNPCSFACKYGAIKKTSTSTVPKIDYKKCKGCFDCVTNCPGLAIFGYDLAKRKLFLPIEFIVNEKEEVFLVDNKGAKLGEGIIEKVWFKPNKTNLVRVAVTEMYSANTELTSIRGFIAQSDFPKAISTKPANEVIASKEFVCHCDDVDIDEILKSIGDRKDISFDEIKHITHLGMGACRGKRCLPRLKQLMRSYGVNIYGEATPRAPLSNPITIGDIRRDSKNTEPNDFVFLKQPIVHKADVLIAGGGVAGSALFRYFAEAGKNPVLINDERGSSWRNIAGGRPAFGIPELADIANKNLDIFRDLQQLNNIDFRQIKYVGFAHDDESYRSLQASMSYSEAMMIDRKDFTKFISPHFNTEQTTYSAALITNNCWQATPGKVIDLIRNIGIEAGGKILEHTKLVEVCKKDDRYSVIMKKADGEYIVYETEIFVNALGAEADKFARQLNIQTGIYPVKHQAFITRRLPMLGVDGQNLNMLIDRRKYKSFSAVYGQQLASTGQIIGCASPISDPSETSKPLITNDKEFLEIFAEVFTDWLPVLRNVGLQAVWSGYYLEPRYIIDPDLGLFVGLRGHGFMLSQYLAKLYVDKVMDRRVPDYFKQLALKEKGVSETVFK